jgi:GDP-mannose 6-dehydrogenase
MRISIFGLGYVGAVTAGCLASQGHSVVGVDVQASKVESLNRGEAPIIEPGLGELLKKALEAGLLRATTDPAEAVRSTEASIICVGTPSGFSGELDLSFVRDVLRQIAGVLQAEPKRHILLVRSTMLPGSTEALIEELLSTVSGLLEVFYYPEFLREGTAVQDFLEPSLAVLGTREASPAPAQIMRLVGKETPIVPYRGAEMLKYACNAFHATKIAFANEIGRLSKEQGIDGLTVMRLLCRDTRLNLSSYYMRPGNPFGGSCLPKDVRALVRQGRTLGAATPLLESLLPSNEHHLRSLLSLIEKANEREVVILGLSFKSNTDDLRESSMVELAQNLLGKGYQLRIYDPQLNLSHLVGSNKRLIDIKMPHLASLLQEDLNSALGKRGVVVAAQRCASSEDLRAGLTPAHQVIDVNGWLELKEITPNYQGFCW